MILCSPADQVNTIATSESGIVAGASPPFDNFHVPCVYQSTAIGRSAYEIVAPYLIPFWSQGTTGVLVHVGTSPI